MSLESEPNTREDRRANLRFARLKSLELAERSGASALALVVAFGLDLASYITVLPTPLRALVGIAIGLTAGVLGGAVSYRTRVHKRNKELHRLRSAEAEFLQELGHLIEPLLEGRSSAR